MEQIQDKRELAAKASANEVPMALPPAPAGGQLAVDAYQNVQVLGHVTSAEMTRLMAAITTWVAGDAGCGYCHAPQRDDKGEIVRNDLGYAQADLNKMWSDELYAKRVARRMLQMTMHVNQDWQQHVKGTGVTCYTCHRGNPVPKNIWFDEPDNTNYDGMVGNKAGQNSPTAGVGLTSLPAAPLRPFLAGDESIRIQSTSAIDSGNRQSIKQTEWTYALMIHMSNSLGVNCTYCHNTRSMGEWQTSPPTRTTAWYGIRMVRDLNKEYLEPLSSILPPERHGPLGDGPKLSCPTCHQGAYKPLLGVSMLADYPVLAKAVAQPPKTLIAQPDADAGIDASGSDLDGGVPNLSMDSGLDAGRPGPTGDGGAPKDAATVDGSK
jgi:photosynthetic reaction center cytochrome c subunit